MDETIELDESFLRGLLEDELEDLYEDDEEREKDFGGGYHPYGEDRPALDPKGRLEPEEKEELEEGEKPDFPDVDDDGDTDESISKAAKDKKEEVKESLQLQRKNKSLLTEQKELNTRVNLLEQKLNKYATIITKFKNKLEESNLANAKLLYQNRVLDSASLNERQKDRIVETISNAKTVEEAKIIYETLQSAVGANAPRSQPKSLNEVVTKRSSAFMPRKEEKRVDTFSERMKILAGIKN